MILFLSITGIFLSAILLYYNARENRSSVFLGLFFSLISIYAFNQYVVLYSKSEFLVSVFFLNIGFLSYLIGPMLYWYIRSVLSDNSHLKKTDLWHLLPMLVFLVATLPHLFSPWAHKVEIATRIIQDSSFFVNYNHTVLYKVPAILVFLSRPLLILAYASWSTRMIIRYLKQKRGISVLSQQQFMTKWLTVLLVFLFIHIFSQILQIYQSYSVRNIISFYTLNLLQILSGAGLTGLLISPFFFPTILYGLPRMPVSKGILKPLEQQTVVLPGEDQKILSSFEADYLDLITQKAESCMEQLRPYLQTDCNLAYFAKLINIPVHHLAYYFREVKNQSFSDFRNEWRVNHAKKLIAEGKANELTLEAIGLLSGFSTRNTFFTAFKKIEGVSPGIFAAKFSE